MVGDIEGRGCPDRGPIEDTVIEAGAKLLLTPEQAADVLSIGRTKLFELLANGTLPSVRIGNCRRVPAAALESFVAELVGAAGRESRPTPSGRTAVADLIGQ